jgi:glycosyltransferase involved in cell wall biosynthesis
MRIALVPQPSDGVLPPRQNSIGLIMFHTAMELSSHAKVTLQMKRRPEYDAAHGYPFAIEQIETKLDDLFTSVVSTYPRWAARFNVAGYAEQFPEYARRVAARLRRTRPDIVHIMNYWSWCKTLAGGRRGHRLILEMQSEWLSQMDVRAVERQLRHADAIVTVSDHIARLFRQVFPSYPGLVETAYNGVNIDVFRPLDAAPTSTNGRSILFVGRTSPEKGVHTLIHAFAQVAAAHDDARLDIVGPRTTLPPRFLVAISDDPIVRRLTDFYDGKITSDYQAHLNALVTSLGLENKVRFHGSLPHADLVAIYQRASIVCNPSFSESFGISIVEGMACGIPVVGTRIGGMQETILHEQTGLIVEADEPDALAAALNKILQDRELASSMRVAGRARAAETFTWEARAKRLMNVYERALSA